MKYTDVQILDFVEGRLSEEQASKLAAEQNTDPELAQTIEAMRVSQLPIAEAYNQQKLPPVPLALVEQFGTTSLGKSTPDAVSTTAVSNSAKSTATAATDQATPSARQTHHSKRAWFGMAACLVSGLGIGALATQYSQQENSISPGGTTPLAATEDHQQMHQRLVKRVADYQSLYVETTVANLSETRLAPVNLSKHHELNAASWIDDDLHYVLVADETDTTLKQIVDTASEVL